MPKFELEQTHSTRESRIEVSVDPANPLPIGTYTFQLVVKDDSGNASEPVKASVVVRDTENPTAVLVAPKYVDYGKSFVLDGGRSVDVGGGKVAVWEFTLVEGPLD